MVVRVIKVIGLLKACNNSETARCDQSGRTDVSQTGRNLSQTNVS